MEATGRFADVHVIGPEAYVKSCDPKDRWSLAVSEDQAGKIAAAVKEGFINVRLIQGRVIDIDDGKSPWYGDNLGRVVEGLTQGGVQLQQSEAASGVVLSHQQPWTLIPRASALGWKTIAVVYVHPQEGSSSENLEKQAKENPTRILYHASTVFPGQYVAVTPAHVAVVGDTLEDVVGYVKGSSAVVAL